MDITRIVGLALITTIFVLIIKREKPALAIMLSMAFSVVVLLMIMGKLVTIVQVLQNMAGRANANYFFLTTVLKILGVAYLTELGAAVCRDAGEEAIASKMELAAKIVIAVMALPIMVAILETLLEIMPG